MRLVVPVARTLSFALFAGAFVLASCAPPSEFTDGSADRDVPTVDVGSTEGSDATDRTQSACIDNDHDGYGLNCPAGIDCNDDDPAITDQCYRCLGHAAGCACAPNTDPVACDITTDTDHALAGECNLGQRNCVNGVWGHCTTIGNHGLHTIQPIQPCPGVCTPGCQTTGACPNAPADLGPDAGVAIAGDPAPVFCPPGSGPGGITLPGGVTTGTGVTTTNCTNLCLQQVSCAGGPSVTTTVTGTVYAPTPPQFGPPDPLYNAIVYVPNAPVAAFTPGIACDLCGAPASGSPLVQAVTGYDGRFTLTNVPVGTNIPLVIQLGRWRRQVVIPVVAPCTTTALPASLTRLPRTQAEGDIPLMAMVTGAVDALECVLRKIGIDDSEFTVPTASGGRGRVQMYIANGSNAPGGGAPSETALFGSATTLSNYDMLLFACEGGQYNEAAADQTRVINYTNGGGRVFATHYSYVWLYNDAPFSGTAQWNVDQPFPSDPILGTIDETFPKGHALSQWLTLVNAAAAPGRIWLNQPRHDFDGVVAPSQNWVYADRPVTVACTGTTSDRNNCGSCGHVCATGATCSSGVCSCAASRTLCGGACVDTMGDASNCGTCGHVCAGATRCVAGACVACGGAGTTTCNTRIANIDFEAAASLPAGITSTSAIPWYVDTTAANAHTGTHSMVSGNISDNGTTSAFQTVTLAGAGSVSFWYRVSSELNYDFLGFYVDGALQSRWSGSVAWTQGTFALATGTHTLEWRYSKDGSVSSGSDSAWVDDILVTAPGGSSCINLTNDPMNCGACGNVCSAGAVCTAGACACPVGQTACGGVCVNRTTDASNCGACGTVCGAGQTCTASVCACPAGTTLCSGQCMALATDGTNCGACGNVCPASTVCSAGSCVCAASRTLCGGTCVDVTHDVNNCGSCGNVCVGGQSCTAGACVACAAGGSTCTMAISSTNFEASASLPAGYTSSSPAWYVDSTAGTAHGGSRSMRGADINDSQTTSVSRSVTLTAAGSVSFWYTVSSETGYDFLAFLIDGVVQAQWSGSVAWTQATFPVPTGTHTLMWRYSKDVSVSVGSDTAWVDDIFVSAPGGCFNLATDPTNCGSCGNVCAAGATCAAGACTCPVGQSLCNGVCVNTATNSNNCGACGASCYGAACVAGACGTCASGLSPCGSACVNLQTDTNNCGACGAACSAGSVCTAGTCHLVTNYLHYTFNTPVGAAPASQCGRAVFSDFHVNNASSGSGVRFPTECDNSPMTAQEKILEFMLFDLASCIAPSGTTGPICAVGSSPCGSICCGAGQMCQVTGASTQCFTPFPPSGTYQQTIDATTSCAAGFAPQWTNLVYVATTPPGTTIGITVYTAATAAGLATATPVNLGTVPPTTSPIDLRAALAAAPVSGILPFMRVVFTLNSDATHMFAPVIDGYQVNFVCQPSF